ncbi:MAG TPA: pyridoxamine 5'-phosphate oxidase family protein, partial [Solirubrobacteraceae bacterium]|nr:pyridoxamine 5'-phosphate oxidase family protein [Solirubrobacteraceae bacterium]
MGITWDDEIEEIVKGDLTVALGYRTPAGGVVVQAVAPIGLGDRDAGTLGFTTSLGFSKKLERIARDPRVAMAFHAREHGFGGGPAYVLVQGTARVIAAPSEAEREQVKTLATRYLGPPAEGFFWDRWLREYYEARVPVEVDVERMLVWPQLDCAGSPRRLGRPPVPGDPPPQKPPRQGSGPRVDAARAGRRVRGTEHRLLGFAGADGWPVIVPVEIEDL